MTGALYGVQHAGCGHVCAVGQTRAQAESVMGGLHRIGLRAWRTRRLDSRLAQEAAIEALLTAACATCTADPAVIAEAAPDLAAYLGRLRATGGGGPR